MLIDGSSSVANYTNTPWTIQKTGSFAAAATAGTGTVTWSVTVGKGTPQSGFALTGYIDLANNTAAPVPVTGLVVNLQKMTAGDWATASSDIADSVSGDAATQANVDVDVTYEGLGSFQENAASGSLVLTDVNHQPITLNGTPQSVPANGTLRLYFVANFNATTLSLATGTPLQVEVIVNLPGTFIMPSLAVLSSVTVPAPTAANSSVTLTDPTYTQSGSVTGTGFTALLQTLTDSAIFPVTLNVDGGANGGTVCNTATLTSSPTSFTVDIAGTPVAVLTIPGVNLSATDCQTIPKKPGGPKPVSPTINSCSQVVTLDTSLFTSDAGTVVSATFSPASGSTFPFGASTVNYSATDSAGNTTTGTLTVNVIDTEGPVIVPINNISVTTDSGKCTAVVTYATTATDCNLSGISYSPVSGTAFPIGTTPVTITATDTAGHTTTSVFSVTVTDTTAPTLHTSPVVAYVVPGTCAAPVAFGATADDCSSVAIIYSLTPDFATTISSGASFPIGATTVYVKATDAAGNSSIGLFSVTVLDNEAPVISAHDIMVNVTAGTCGANVAFDTTATDCSGTTLTFSLSPAFSSPISSGATFPIGATTVYVKAQDGAGNVSTTSFTVTVVDNEAPVITTAPVVTNVTPGTCSASVAFTATATDCGTVTLVYSLDAGFSKLITSGASFPIGTTTVYVRATDDTGNASTTSFPVTVVDNEAPVITASNLQVNVVPGTCSAAVLFNARATDCSGAILTYALDDKFTVSVNSGATFPVGTTVVYVKATDSFGNASTSSFTVTVLDNEAPVIGTMPDVTVNTDAGKCTAVVTYAAKAADCSAVTLTYSVAPGTAFPIGTTPVTVTATDASGNSSAITFNVIVKDATAPTLHTTNVQTNVIAGTCSANVSFAATADDCSAVTLVYSLAADFSSTIASGASFPVGTTTVYVQATDSFGNAASSSFAVTVIDNEAPVIATISDIKVNTDSGKCTATVTYAAKVTDCSAVTLAYSVAPGSVFPIGTTPVTVTATDAAGNKSTLTFNVIVQDATAPVLSVANVQVTATAGTCGANVTFPASVTDCSAVVLQFSLRADFSTLIASGANFPIGTTTVYARATDAAGNLATASFKVTVVDTQAPVISAPNVVVNNTPGQCGAQVSFAATASDCTSVTLVYSLSSTFSSLISSGANFPVGTTTVYVKATDASGNVSTSSFTVAVKDTEAPTITSSLSNIKLTPDYCRCVATFCYIPTAIDNCNGSVKVTVSPASGTVLSAGTTTTVTVTATDSAGNTTTKTFTVTVASCPITQTTYTQGGWGAPPSGNNPGTLLWKYFSYVYPYGLTVGGKYTVKFTSASAITNALPLTGTPAVLTRSSINPLSGNTFLSQVVALKLNVDFSERGLLPVNRAHLADMKVTSGKLDGWTVSQVLTLCNAVLGGNTGALPAGVTVSDLTNIAAAINGNFDNGSVNLGYLEY